MSEIRETTTIEDIVFRQPEPVRSLEQLLSGLGPLVRSQAFLQRGDGRKAMFGNSSTSKITSPLVRLQSIMRTAKSAREAASLVCQQVPLHVLASDSEHWEKALQESILKNDIPSLIRTVGHLANVQQERSQKYLVDLTAGVLFRRGFTAQTKQVKDGIIVAKKPGSSQIMTVDVSRSKDGTIGMHYDLDGFHGDSCIETLDGVQSDLAELGVKTAKTSSHRKDPRRAFDGRRIANVLHQGQ